MLTAKIISKSNDSEESVTLLVDFFEDGVQVGMRQSVRVSLRSSPEEVQKTIADRGYSVSSSKKAEAAVDVLVGQTINIPDKVPADPVLTAPARV